MKQKHLPLFLFASLLLPLANLRASTEGDNLIGIGAASRSSGGTGVASPADVLGAISDNPAGLSLLPATQLREFDASLTLFLPHVNASVGGVSAQSDSKIYPIPSFAFASLVEARDASWVYGIAAYGVSGLGVDYHGTAIDTTLTPTPFPLVAGTRTELKLGEIAPALSYRISPQWTVGLAVNLDYGRLDLGGGGKHGFGLGIQPGITYQPNERLTFGFSYTSPKPITYKAVIDFDGDSTLDNLKLASPSQLKFGVGYELLPSQLHVSLAVRRTGWGDAAGYSDFGWRNTWNYALGLNYTAIPDKLAFHFGYNVGYNPVKVQNGFNGTGGPGNVTAVQGKNVPNYYYQTFRIIGFPAIVNQHLSFGVEYHATDHVVINAGFTHSFKNRITESGTNLLGAPVTLSSSLSEDSIELGLRYAF
jgi:long-chain fatty acid transport protein